MGALARRTVGALALAGLALVASGCGDDEPPPLTIEERLSLVAGRDLTTAELNTQLELGDLLCGMTDEVLDATWLRLDDEQLAFQDVVFGHMCPQRAVLYAGHTGRYVTDEAIESGVTTSTTRPTTTTAGRLTSSTQTSQVPDGTDPNAPTVGDDSDGDDSESDDSDQPRATIGPATDPSSTTSSPTVSPTTRPESTTASTASPSSSTSSTVPNGVTTSVRTPTTP